MLHPGDLFIWAVPNAGNPQKVQRFASDWAAALREMAGCGAELHAVRARRADLRRRPHPPGAHRHGRAARRHRDADAGVDEPEACRSTGCCTRWRSPSGCASCRTCSRSTTTRSSSSATCGGATAGGTTASPTTSCRPRGPSRRRSGSTLAGGLEAVLAARPPAGRRAATTAWPATSSSSPCSSNPGSAEAHEVRAEVYAARSAEQVSSMARNILGHAAHASRQGRRDLAGDYG